MNIRKNVWGLGDDWADEILWYARGVKAMKERHLAEPTSWSFYAGIHGFFQPLWKLYGYLPAGEPMPSAADLAAFWDQCQHGSWYFLPWHRGYLLAFEANIRAEVVKAGGPEDWALPYWNYFKTDQSALPPAFASPDWPDGKGNNPLFVPQRYGPNNDGDVFVPLDQVNLDAMTDPDFTGVASGGSPGFGGVDTGFEHSGRVHGGIETQPHDWVHGLVGGNPQNPQLPGLMSDPDTAGLDPIFWLHHANIDRLWQVWRENPPTNIDPTEPHWIDGPASVGERIFSLPMPGGATFDYTPGEMVDLTALGYEYDDLAAEGTPDTPVDRMTRLAPDGVAASFAGGNTVPTEKNVELVGANQQPLRISGGGAVSTSVQLNPAARRKVSASLMAAAETAAPDRVFLNLENVRGLVDSTAFHVFVSARNPNAGLAEAAPQEEKAGSIALFGVRKATQGDGAHGGQGLTFVLEITKLIDTLHLSDALDIDSLDVRIEPVKDVPAEADVTIGRVSIFRQGK